MGLDIIAPSLDFLCEIQVDTSAGGFVVGETPSGRRLVGLAAGGTVEGPGIAGSLSAGSGDWALISSDGCFHLDFRGMIRTHDDVGLYLTQSGRLHAPESLRPALNDRSRWQDLDPLAYYFRTTAAFEAPLGPYAWMNRIVAVGTARLEAGRVVYRLFQVL